ncbi:hypothetical protein [Streptomyces sp. NPDC047014]|uniref:hypothetical protein n=1 Tax=Streptomyces sp. NPDC047014 TaxID=3155736 RepID=UPI0033CA568A
MTVDKATGFPLPPGATGFSRARGAPLPTTLPRTFRAALHAAAREAGGRVEGMEEQAYPRTFHSAAVVAGAGAEGAVAVVLCHAHHPWITFAGKRRDWYTDTEEFLPPPPWSRTFADLGFTVLDRAQLALPLSKVDTSALTRAEWRQIRSYEVTTLGGILFNAWD